MLSKKYFQKWGVGEKDMKGQWPYREGVVYRRGFKLSVHYGWKLSKHFKPGKTAKAMEMKESTLNSHQMFSTSYMLNNHIDLGQSIQEWTK